MADFAFRSRLAQMGQEHLLAFWDELSKESREAFAHQLETLDYSVLREMNEETPRGTFSPIDALTLARRAPDEALYEREGLAALRAGKVGAVLLAGGQGSRLGFDKPKGMFNVGVNRELTIFECLFENLKAVERKAGVSVPLYIMVSEDNARETKDFLREHAYFGRKPESVRFFVQEQLPAVTPQGRLMLAAKDKVLTAPNGNGGWYASLAANGLVGELRQRGIEWLNVFSVDNVLQRMADPCFLGAVLRSGKVSGAKVIAKAGPEERVGVMCLEDGRPSIVEYYEMTPQMLEQTEKNGTLSYRWGVTLNYLFRVDCLDKTLHTRLPLHRAFKAVRCLNEAGESVQPQEPNAYKFETLALDMVRLQENCLVYEVERQKEFAPVKNKEGVDSADTARVLLAANGVAL